jgi:hypothetical protein
MLVEFDVDCGYLIEGHRFIARGLEDNGIESGPTAADSAPGFSFAKNGWSHDVTLGL